MGVQDEKDVVKVLLEFEENERWFDRHYKELQEKFPNMVLAIKDKKIISMSPEIEELINDLRMKSVNTSSVYIGTIPPKGIAFIL